MSIDVVPPSNKKLFNPYSTRSIVVKPFFTPDSATWLTLPIIVPSPARVNPDGNDPELILYLTSAPTNVVVATIESVLDWFGLIEPTSVGVTNDIVVSTSPSILIKNVL